MMARLFTLLNFFILAGISANLWAAENQLSPQAMQALEQLNDIALPDPIGWWPLAFSWWILLLSVTSILIGITWYFLDLKRRNVYRKQAQDQLSEIMQNDEIDAHKIQQINRLLKQVALTAYGRQRVASLKQDEWVKFLAENANYIQQPKSLNQFLLLGYSNQKNLKEELTTCHDYARKWIKGHHQ
ncbi:DUF4381 domain-containing protein [Thiomicrorhabdus indica]|uniref:DUF4381 domain-containing protein n=1 Tax=Thiomicrorhabdus indica TaxID=2267253 RepID=UPI002AA821D3|nr:DUF4381 domain-containing protein [Thiomicrorhabdus indica]